MVKEILLSTDRLLKYEKETLEKMDREENDNEKSVLPELRQSS